MYKYILFKKIFFKLTSFEKENIKCEFKECQKYPNLFYDNFGLFNNK